MNQAISILLRRILLLSILWLGSGIVWAQAIVSMIEPARNFSADPEEQPDWIYYSLSCDVQEWGGYFSPDNWQVATEEGFPLPTSDEYFDATSGKGHSDTGILIKGARAQVRSWSIEVPTTGFLSFRLMGIDGTALPYITFGINDRYEKFGIQADGTFFSPFLRAGDRFRVYIPSGEEPLRWSNLTFHTNFRGVIVYPAAVRISERFRPVDESPIARISFPETGFESWPVFDYDGDISTIDDRIQLRNSNDVFDVQYSDETVRRRRDFVIERTFRITERCNSDNALEHKVLWRPLPLMPGGRTR